MTSGAHERSRAPGAIPTLGAGARAWLLLGWLILVLVLSLSSPLGRLLARFAR